ncbi:hypothetical protein JOB18_018801 [Solea senegalensis]|uniref:Uncharacterized protein n=1 Tax=Solea senegalensis TaxID=28829 RepID=A0AAV6PEG0_SOLSE|nr:hypothetical protein JOB18_018801 [Solea senegalensis]
MDAEQNDGLGARHLSQIKEESESREHSTCFLPPIARRRHTGGRGPVVDEVEGQEVEGQQEVSGAAPLSDQQREVEDNRSLLEELGRIEAELRETLRLDMERQQEAEFLHQQENMTLWQNLCYLSLSQRVAKYTHTHTVS